MNINGGNVRVADAQAIAEAGERLRAGELVAFPTETVYGLGADATNDRAVASIFRAKGRPNFNPLIVHVADLDAAMRLGRFTDGARRLAERFWPGPLTLVVPEDPNSGLSKRVTAGLGTVAIRVPGNPVAQRLLRAAACPIAAPSANASGRISPTLASHVTQSLGTAACLILDGGPTTLGLESTIVGFHHGSPVLLRAGAVSREDLAGIVGALETPAPNTVSAPGQLASHYAPRTPLRMNAQDAGPDEAYLAFGPIVPREAKFVRNLSPTSDLNEAAANLFAMLHELDASGADRIAVAPIPETGLGDAINDRLRRAAWTGTHES